MEPTAGGDDSLLHASRAWGWAELMNLGELMRFVEMIEDEGLREKVRAFLEERKVSLTGEPIPLEESPGGRSHHHAYPGGLLQHTVATVRLALSLCDLVEQVYGGEVDRDIVIAASILHDVMKAPCYAEREDGTYTFSPLGERLDHVSLIVAELVRRDFPLDVIHAVAAHHAEHGPISPRTLEALIVHIADLADSRLNGEVLRAARFLLREATGSEPPPKLSHEHAFRIVVIKAREGWDGVRRYAEEAGLVREAEEGA